ncbi:hypothetical protein [Pectinatus frisingensis]|uniref:hypothetical protein n=1 Tax=Pectinatus frisingensis TaxID=865 RepID=UPI0018C53EAC|nr:hypothetical protein [Pectinatus frisingensis]
MKYTVECGGFVEFLRRRKLTIYADSKEEAEEKARDKFWEIFKDAANIGHVNIDSCEQED